MVVPENKRKFIVFSFRPVDSIVFLKLRYVLFHSLLTTFLWMSVQWTSDMHLLHISKNNFGVKIHFKIRIKVRFSLGWRITKASHKSIWGPSTILCVLGMIIWERWKAKMSNLYPSPPPPPPIGGHMMNILISGIVFLFGSM